MAGETSLYLIKYSRNYRKLKNRIMSISRNIPELDRRGLRQFVWIFSGVVAVLFGIIVPLLFNRDFSWIPWAISIVFFFWGLVAPNTLRIFYRLWMRFGFVMNAIMTRAILSIVFYIAILPYGIVFRLQGKDPMNRTWRNHLNSYRINSPKTSSKRMEKPF